MKSLQNMENNILQRAWLDGEKHLQLDFSPTTELGWTSDGAGLPKPWFHPGGGRDVGLGRVPGRALVPGRTALRAQPTGLLRGFSDVYSRLLQMFDQSLVEHLHLVVTLVGRRKQC